MPETASSPRTDALDALVELLSELDEDSESSGTYFYDRICEAVCRLTSMERDALMLYDDTRKLVVPVGSHGVDPGLLSQVYGTLEETPIAQRALGEDRVVEVSEHLEREVPPRYARFAGVTTLTCTPVSAAWWSSAARTASGGCASWCPCARRVRRERLPPSARARRGRPRRRPLGLPVALD